MKRNREVYIIVDALLRNNVIQEKDAKKAGVAVKAAMKTIRSERYARKVIEKNLNSIESFIAEKYQGCGKAFNRYKAVNIYALLNLSLIHISEPTRP